MNPNIKRIVVVMLENRGFDSILGYLYTPEAPPLRNIPAPASDEPPFNGLAYVKDPNELVNTAQWKDKNLKSGPFPGVRATNSPGWDPGEEYEHVNKQLFNKKDVNPNEKPSMTGFLKDYSTISDSDDYNTIYQIMAMHLPYELPVISQLAKKYAVCDQWFSSVPTQTNANRAFSLCGTSNGLVDNGYLSSNIVTQHLAADKFEVNTIFNTLNNNGFTNWGVFWEDKYPPAISDYPYTRFCFPMVEQIPEVDKHFHKMEKFYDLAEAGELPAFSYIEPKWGGAIMDVISVMGNEYHPPSDVTPGEAFIKKIYSSLIKNQAAWQETMLLIFFDEHGGTYDHEPPPWGATPPWGNTEPPASLPKGVQYGFKFDRYGVRIPAIVCSPYIEEGTVFRSETNTPFDHTSMIATVLKVLLPDVSQSNWNLGERVTKAPTFEFVNTRNEARMNDNVFKKTPPKIIGEPVELGDPIYLKHRDGQYLSFAESDISGYYPTLGSVPVTLRFQLSLNTLSRTIDDGQRVQIRTDEYLKPEFNDEPFFEAAIRNTLFASKKTHSWEPGSKCYYYSTNDRKNFPEQKWFLMRNVLKQGVLKYGDEVYIQSGAPKYIKNRLIKSGNYLGIVDGSKEYWTIEPAPGP